MIRRVFLIFVLLGVTACGDDGTGTESVVGSYVLQTVDGGSLPWVASGSTEITAELVILNADMSCRRRSTGPTTDGGSVTVTNECTYTMKFEAIFLTFSPNSAPHRGSIVGSTLTLTSPGSGSVFIYER